MTSVIEIYKLSPMQAGMLFHVLNGLNGYANCGLE
jgi:hypothetical protein